MTLKISDGQKKKDLETRLKRRDREKLTLWVEGEKINRVREKLDWEETRIWGR